MTDLVWTPASDDDPEFTITTASLHSVLAGRSAAGAHPATALTYDPTVSGLTGDTVQEAIDELEAGKVPTARTITAGTGLTGGGDLSADRTLTVTYGATAGTAAEGNDPRLTNARPPTAHEASHHHDGSDPLSAVDVGAVPVESVGLLPGETNRGTWDIAATYAVGDVVFETGSDMYVATAPSTGAQPSLTPGSWDVLDPTGRHVRLGPGATSGDYGTAVGPSATSGDFGTAVGPGATAGDYEVNVANTYRATLDPGDPATPLTATIATGHVDLPETADVTNPPVDHQRLVARTDGLYVRDQAGTEVGPLGAGGGGGIPETLIDAAGDLIVGTAADTAARLAVGTTGQVLTSNGTTAAWATPPTAPHIVAKETGEFYSLRGITTAASSHGLVLAAGSLHSIPVWLDAGNYDRIGVVTTVAAVSTWRLGVYPSDPTTGRPDGQAPLHDAGTLSTNATAGQLLITTSFTIPTRGVYWLACLVDAFTAAPTVHGWAASNSAFQPDALGVPTSNSSATVAQSRIARSATGVATGAMPATYPASAWANGGAVKIIVRSA